MLMSHRSLQPLAVTLTLAFLVPGVMPRAAAEELSAVLIGIDRYQDSKLRPLDLDRDLRDLSETLLQCGYQSITSLRGEQATRVRIMTAIGKVASRLGGGDTLLIFFAGYWTRLAGNDEGYDEAYLCPFDARADDRTSLIALREIDDILTRARGTKILLVNVLAVSRTLGRDQPLVRPNWKPRSGATIIVCEAKRDRSYESSPASIFTHAIVDALRGETVHHRIIRETDLMAEIGYAEGGEGVVLGLGAIRPIVVGAERTRFSRIGVSKMPSGGRGYYVTFSPEERVANAAGITPLNSLAEVSTDGPQAGIAWHVTCFRDKPSRADREGFSVERAGEIVAMAIARQLSAMRFETAVDLSNPPEDMRVQLSPQMSLDLSRFGFVLRLEGEADLRIAHRSDAQCDKTAATLEVDLTVTAQRERAEQRIYGHRFENRCELEGKGLAGRPQRGKDAASRVLQDFVAEFVRDEKLAADVRRELDQLRGRQEDPETPP